MYSYILGTYVYKTGCTVLTPDDRNTKWLQSFNSGQIGAETKAVVSHIQPQPCLLLFFLCKYICIYVYM